VAYASPSAVPTVFTQTALASQGQHLGEFDSARSEVAGYGQTYSRPAPPAASGLAVGEPSLRRMISHWSRRRQRRFAVFRQRWRWIGTAGLILRSMEEASLLWPAARVIKRCGHRPESLRPASKILADGVGRAQRPTSCRRVSGRDAPVGPGTRLRCGATCRSTALLDSEWLKATSVRSRYGRRGVGERQPGTTGLARLVRALQLQVREWHMDNQGDQG
jgi:hypothetical protein